jgi:hypothetical protein
MTLFASASCPGRATEQNTPAPDSPARHLEESTMAKGQMRQSKEKKKPKQDKEKKKGTSAYAQAYHAQPGSSPIGGNPMGKKE